MSEPILLSNHSKLKDFLSSHFAGTLAVPIDTEGTLHAAAIMYWHSPTPLRFYFVTSRETEKCTLLKTQSEVQAAYVVGTEKDTPYSVQLRGTLHEIDPEDHPAIVESYYQKRDNRHDDVSDPANCLLEFIPGWGRFTDYSQGYDRYFLDLGKKK